MQIENEQKTVRRQHTFVRRLTSFLIIGAIPTFAGSWFVTWATTTLGMNSNLANLIQAVVSIVANFLLNGRFTWNDVESNLSFWQKAWRYAKVKAFTLGYNVFVFWVAPVAYPGAVVLVWILLPQLLPVFHYFPQDTFAYYVATAVVMIFNYLAGDNYIYRDKPSTRGSRKKV